MIRRMFNLTPGGYSFDDFPNFSKITKSIIIPLRSNSSSSTTNLYHLPAFWIPATKQDSEKTPQQQPYRLVVFFHGSSSNIGHSLPDWDFPLPANTDVLLVEVPGYGISSPFYPGGGESMPLPGTDSFRYAGAAVLKWIRESLEIPMSEVLLVTRSISTGLGLELVAGMKGEDDDVVSGHLMIAPIVSLPKIVQDILGSARITSYYVAACHFGGATYFSQDQVMAEAAKKCPVTFVAHGEADSFANVKHAHELVKIARDAGVGEGRLQLFLDPKGDHMTVDFRPPLLKLLERVAKSEKRESEQPRRMQVAEKLSALQPSNELLAELRVAFERDSKAAASFKTRRINAMRALVVLVVAGGIAGISALGWKAFRAFSG